jgi:hypothetical protein
MTSLLVINHLVQASPSPLILPPPPPSASPFQHRQPRVMSSDLDSSTSGAPSTADSLALPITRGSDNSSQDGASTPPLSRALPATGANAGDTTRASWLMNNGGIVSTASSLASTGGRKVSVIQHDRMPTESMMKVSGADCISGLYCLNTSSL